MSGRIDPAPVATWFRGHPEVRVLRSCFADYERDEDGRRGRLLGCCGLASRVVDDPRFPPEALDAWPGVGPDEAQLRRIADALGLGPFYAEGFCAGWDGRGMPSHATRSGEAGFRDGRAAYAATIVVSIA